MGGDDLINFQLRAAAPSADELQVVGTDESAADDDGKSAGDNHAKSADGAGPDKEDDMDLWRIM